QLMPTPFGRSHWPPQSGYFDSSWLDAPVLASASAPSSASPASEFLLKCMMISLVCLGPSLRAEYNVCAEIRKGTIGSRIRSMHGMTAVDLDGGAADEAGAVGGEEHNRLGDLRSVPGTTGRKLRVQLGPAVLVAEEALRACHH